MKRLWFITLLLLVLAPLSPSLAQPPDGLQEITPNDFQISDSGIIGDPAIDAVNSSIAFNPTTNQYLVVWEGDDLDPALAVGEDEIWGQLIDAAGNRVGDYFRISDMGPDGTGIFDARDPKVVYNSALNEFMVVWEGDDDAATVNDEVEIFGQRISAAGTEIGADFRISNAGPDGDPNFDATNPDIVYNSVANQYLVVWDGESAVDGENEIYGQIIDATGAEVGTDFVISDMGPPGDVVFDAVTPAVEYSPVTNEYTVIWRADDNPNDAFEIYGQRISAAGTEVGPNDFRISDMGAADADTGFGAFPNPEIAYDSITDQFLVVWQGEDDTAPLVGGESEIFGQLINSAGAEVGPNDIRISDMGPDGDTGFDAFNPSVAFGAGSGEFFVTWQSDDDTGTAVNDETEIWGQRITAAGAEAGPNDIRISDNGPDGDPTFDAQNPQVVYNSNAGEFVTVWQSDDDTPPQTNEEFEIFGQRTNLAGAPVGTNDFKVSEVGQDIDPAFSADDPKVAFNGANNQFLVIWEGTDNVGGLTFGENEIFGQLLDAAGNPVGNDDFRISFMGPDGDGGFDARNPSLTYNSALNEYLVVWSGDTDAPTVNDEFEIWGQRISAAGALIGGNFRISDMGPDGDPAFGADSPDVTYNAATGQYLVVWAGDDGVDGENEIYGQLLDAAGNEIGVNDFRISNMGPDGDITFDALNPDVVYNPVSGEYLVAWSGDNLSNDDVEIWGQRINGAGAQVGANDFRISDAGPDGDINFAATTPDITVNTNTGDYLVAWAGDDNVGTLVDGENEIFGQLLNAAGAEIGANDFRISDMGPDGTGAFDAFTPAVSFSPALNQFFVSWSGDDVNDEREVYGQQLSATGLEVGGNDVRLSDAGPDGSTLYNATVPAVAYNPATNNYLLVWTADEDIAPLTNNKFEIFGQLVEPFPFEILASPAGGSDAIAAAAPGTGVIKTVSQQIGQPGDRVTFTINFSTADQLGNVSISDQFDPRLTNIQLVSTTVGTGRVSGNRLTVDGFDLGAGSSASVVVAATIGGNARPGDVIPNVANLAWNGGGLQSNTVEIRILPNFLPNTGERNTDHSWLLLIAIAGIGLAVWRVRRLSQA